MQLPPPRLTQWLCVNPQAAMRCDSTPSAHAWYKAAVRLPGGQLRGPGRHARIALRPVKPLDRSGLCRGIERCPAYCSSSPQRTPPTPHASTQRHNHTISRAGPACCAPYNRRLSLRRLRQLAAGVPPPAAEEQPQRRTAPAPAPWTGCASSPTTSRAACRRRRAPTQTPASIW